jgi:NHL repeat
LNDDTQVPMRPRARLVLAAALIGGSLLSCSGGTPVNAPALDGTVSGTVTSTLGGGLSGLPVVVTPTGGTAMAPVTTSSTGSFSVANVPIGSAGTGTITVSGTPLNCRPPGPTNYSGLNSNTGASQNVSVTCATPLDTLNGTITSSLGGGVAGVTAVVTPTGGTALSGVTSSSSGAFTVNGVSATGGTITLSNIPSNCITPSPVSYSGVAAGGPTAVSITLQCSASAAAITGTILTSQGNVPIGAGVGVIVTPQGQSALPAVATSSSSTFMITGVPVSNGTGTLTFTNLPSNCPTPASPTAYSGLTNGGTLNLNNITITCNPPSGTISGTITSSLGGGIATIGVVVTPAGGAALPSVTTSSSGSYSVSGVLIGTGATAGTGTVTLNHLTANCTQPNPAPYAGLTNGQTVTVNIAVTCTTPYGTVRGTLVTSFGMPISGVMATVTPTGGSPVSAVAPSDTTGLFIVGGVPVGNGAGSVTYADLPVNCPTLGPTPYTGLTNARQINVYVVGQCTQTGAIVVFVSPEGGLAPPTTANVAITGPDGAPGLNTPITVTTPELVNPLDPGSFTITPSSYLTFDPTVPQMFFPDSINEVHVASAVETVSIGVLDSATITYAWQEGTGELWVADSATTLLSGFSGPQLRQGGGTAASSIITPASQTAPTGMALDPNNRLWVSIGSANEVLEYRDSAEYGGVWPAVVTVNSGLGNPQGMAFDKNGILWVANAGNNTITGITIVGQVVSASVTSTVTSTALNEPTGLAFDATGNLWVSNLGNNTVVVFSASQLATAGAQTPTVVLSATSGSLSGPTGLAFDASGDLWVANATGNSVVELLSSSLGSTGSPAPAVTISTNAGSLAAPRALAFDMGGDLWVGNEASNDLAEYTPTQLASGGGVAPSSTTTSSGVLGGPVALVFNPQPPNLPINGSRVTTILRPGVKYRLKTKAATTTLRK